jgi:hypothetical protein
MAVTSAGVSAADQLLFAAGMCLVAAWLAWLLHKACEHPLVMDPVEEAAPPTGGMGH